MSSWRETLFTLPPDPPRVGVHYSDIAKDLLIYLNEQKYGKPIDEEARHRFERGFAFESMLGARYYPKDVITQVEFVSDHIIHTLDGFDPIEEETWESKCTAYSMNRGLDDPELISWKWQTCNYQRVSRSKAVNLIVMWINGNYRPMSTITKKYRRCYSPIEQSELWDMIRRHRDRMKKQGRLPNG